ncbi:uncharacterized protein [Ptychodera flava]|uniref:uncharacterized protein n=1 Tax=Ptychodera flava TaxID=63121 RepID=UPI00396A994F
MSHTATCGSQVLLKAVSAGRPRQVRLLLESGVCTEHSDECGQTALIRACFIENLKNQLNITKMLLKAGAVVSKSDIVGRNALHWACLYGREKVVHQLLVYSDLELDLNHSDMNGCTALFYASSSGSAATVKIMVDWLKRYSLTVDVPTLNGMTPLMQALRLGHDVCASILIHQGKASTTRRDKDFMSARDWAKQTDKSGRKNTVEVGRSKHTFPPIISQTVANIIRYRENRARQRINSESEDEHSDSEGQDGFTDVLETVDSQDDERFSSSLSISTPDITSKDQAVICDDGDGMLWSSDEDDQTLSTSKSRPSHGQLRRHHDLRKIYSMYEEQLAESFRPGYLKRPRKGDKDSPESHNWSDCKLDCCSDVVRPTILVTDEMIQNVVAANRQAREKKITNTARKDNYNRDESLMNSRENWTDLRKRIAFRNSNIFTALGHKWHSDPQLPQKPKGLVVNGDSNHSNNAKGNAEDKKEVTKKPTTTLPSLGDGKISLVSRNNRASDDDDENKKSGP